MARVRVYEIAKEYGVESRVILAKLQELGLSASTASSSVDAPAVRKLVDALSGPTATARAASLIHHPFAGHADRLFSVAFSPDGTTVATGGHGATRLWDPATGEELRTLTGHTGPVRSVAFSPDGATVVTGGDDGTRLWDPVTGEELRTLTGRSGSVFSVAFSPDGATVVTGGDDGTRLWDPVSGEELRTLTGHTGPVRSVAFSPDGATVVTGGDDGTRLWDPVSGEELRTLTGHTGPVVSVAFGPNGATVATGGHGGVVRLWDPVTGEELRTLTGNTSPVFSVAFSPDGTTLASSGFDGVVRLWDPVTGEELRTLTGNTSPVFSVAFSPDGATVATGGDDGTRLWDPATGEELDTLTGRSGWAVSVAFDPDGTTVATGGFDGVVRLWDPVTGEELRTLIGRSGPVFSVAFSPDGTTLASSGFDGVVRLWGPVTGEELRTLTGHTSPVRSVAFSPDGTMVATSGHGGTVRLWDPATGKEVRTLPGHTSPVAFSPDGTTLATGDLGAVRLWDPATGEELRTLIGRGRIGQVRSVAFSPDGATVATVGDDGARLWDPATGEELLRTFTAHAGQVRSVAFSPDGTTLATGGNDGIRLWDPAAGGELLRTLTGHTGPVVSMAFSPDGTTLASTGDDGTIRTWDPATGQQQAGTGFDEALRFLRPLPGLHSDTSSSDDLLNNAADVEMLARLAAARDTRPPLAIALLGAWGAGKSSFMDQMRRQVAQLADLSANNPGRSAFASEVRQIRFNAWHYSDDHLWAGLIEHLFQSLAEAPGQEAVASDPATVRAERERLITRLASLQDDQRHLKTQLAQTEASRPGGFVAFLGSPVEALRMPFLAGRMIVRDAWRGKWVIIGLVVAAAVAYPSRHWLTAWAAALIGAAGVLVPSVLPVWLVVRRWHQQGQTITSRLRTSLEGRQRRLRDEVSAAQSRLAEVDAAVRLADFLADRSGPNAYQEYRGLLGQVHRDLLQLSDTLREVRAQWESARPATPPPLERIVLYIDDLDRCSPARVVEVLAAVHLMLALPLFVVVVAVDARWLLNSLQHHYRELFAAEATDAPVDPQDSATPLDYLDKIFQIPFAVPSATPETTGRYLSTLLGEPTPTAGRPAASAAPGHGLAPQPSRPAGAPGSAGSTEPVEFSGAGHGMTPDPFREVFQLPGGMPAGAQPMVPDLQPEQLTLQAVEIAFMSRLGGLTPTPRAAKKLVNLYRLVRIGVDRNELPAFVGTERNPGTHQVVQLLLAVLVGSPRHSTAVFDAILKADPADDISTVLKGAPQDHTAEHHLAGLIEELSATSPIITATTIYQSWCPHLARFSFHTRSLA
ncbi:translation initiation factor IF-2 N-terminal domain-containing protein [Streptomyces sp. NBC_01537]|uniref:translation initiation factor IF-2 N-terminal domain-containing protein n=1 Tax=Streptomyces sp. NBC_01537 TaxID=2903896 RepID=UPI003866461E